MGSCPKCCCCCCNSSSSSSDNSSDSNISLKKPLLDSLPSQPRHRTMSRFEVETANFATNALAITAQLVSVSGLPMCDPFVELHVSNNPNDLQQSHQISHCKNPTWAPPFRAVFSPYSEDDLTPQKSVKLCLSVLSKSRIGKDTEIADGIVKLSTIPLYAHFQHQHVQLYDSHTGERIKECFAELELKIDCAFKAAATKVDELYEYQRWRPLKGWTSELLPTDPGRWSSEDGKNYYKAFEEAVGVLDDDWEVSSEWQIYSRPASGRAWEYAWGFRLRFFDEEGLFTRVRRRIWRRVIHKVGIGKSEDEV